MKESAIDATPKMEQPPTLEQIAVKDWKRVISMLEFEWDEVREISLAAPFDLWG